MKKVHGPTPKRREELFLKFIHQEYLKKTWRGEGLAPQRLRSLSMSTRDLWRSFTSERRNLKKGYLSRKEARSAYLLSFHQAGMERVHFVLTEMARQGVFPKKEISALEIGSAFGPGLWALRERASKGKVQLKQVEAWDLNKSMLGDAKNLWNFAGHSPELYTRVVDLHREIPRAKERKDLIFLVNVLNELQKAPEKGAGLICEILEKLLDSQGHLIVLEPALQRTSRYLTDVRDLLMERGVHVLSPCTHEEVCPMSSEKRDWCNFHQRWKSPPTRTRIYENLDVNPNDLGFSYLVLTRASVEKKKEEFRVLSDWMKTEKGLVVNLCAPRQKKRLFLQSKGRRKGSRVVLPSRHSILELPVESLEKESTWRVPAKDLKTV